MRLHPQTIYLGVLLLAAALGTGAALAQMGVL